MNLAVLGISEDIKADDLGVWTAVGSPSILAVVDDDMSIEVMPRRVKVKDRDDKQEQSAFRVTRSYYRHSVHSDFHKIITVAKSE